MMAYFKTKQAQKANFFYFFFQSMHADAKPGYSTRAGMPCRLQLRSSQINHAMLPQVLHDCEFAATSCYISETVQASTKVTTECKYNAECKCGVAYTPLFFISISFYHTSCSCYVLAHVCMHRPICVCVLFIFPVY